MRKKKYLYCASDNREYFDSLDCKAAERARFFKRSREGAKHAGPVSDEEDRLVRVKSAICAGMQNRKNIPVSLPKLKCLES